jgi:hypothetical protein
MYITDNENVPCWPGGMRDSEYTLLRESAALGFRENAGIEVSVVDDIELDRATSGSGKA